MPRVRVPQSDEGRVQLLSKVQVTYAADEVAQRAYLPPALIERIGAVLEDRTNESGEVVPGYRKNVQRLTQKRAAKAREVEEADQADGKLENYMRDFWEVLRRRTFRLGHAAAVLNFYDLPQDGSTPVVASRADRYAWAQKIADGEAGAVAAGYPAMANPSAGEVSQKLQAAKLESGQITPKEREEEEVLELVRAQRPAAIERVDDVLDELRYVLRKMEPGTARNIMRSYGVEFEFLPGETPDEEPPANGGGGETPPPGP
jgi:hypothetical protein